MKDAIVGTEREFEVLPERWQERTEELIGKPLNPVQHFFIVIAAINADSSYEAHLDETEDSYNGYTKNIENIEAVIALIERRVSERNNLRYTPSQTDDDWRLVGSNDNLSVNECVRMIKGLKILRTEQSSEREALTEWHEALFSNARKSAFIRNDYWRELWDIWTFEFDMDPRCCRYGRGKSKKSESATIPSHRFNGDVLKFIQICSEKIFPKDSNRSKIVPVWSGKNGIIHDYRKDPRISSKYW